MQNHRLATILQLVLGFALTYGVIFVAVDFWNDQTEQHIQGPDPIRAADTTTVTGLPS